MSKPKHTPGPWKVLTDDGRKNIGIESAEVVTGYAPYHKVAFVHITAWKVDRRDARPDAHLIAAAPEMFEVLETFENDDNKIPAWLWDKVKAVIAKAKGEL